MDATGGFTLLADEKFDFDISLSPTSAKEDNDDEVFVGPIGHKEKCVSAVLKSQSSEERSSPLNTELVVWSPLSGDKFVEIFKEAHLLALQLESFDQKKEEPPQTVPNPTIEKFVQESKSKLNLFDEFNEIPKTPVAIKRETYCIQESPFHQLPPSVQQRFTGSNKKAENVCRMESQNLTSPLKVPKPVKSHSSSPLVLKTNASQIKSGGPSANNGKTVSKLQPMKAPAVHTKNHRLTVEKPKAIKKISPARRKNLSSLGSTEDLLSDRSSMASDVSDSSFNTSIVGPSKRTLPVPNKVGLSKVQFKTPSATAGCRRNTSSSSSSHSNTSLNSSLSSPPAADAKLNASLNTSMNTSVSSSRLKSNTSRLALVRPHGGVGSSIKSTDSSNGHLKPVTASKPAGNKLASASISQLQTPSGKIHRQSSAPNLQRLLPPTKVESAVKGTSGKPQARVMPTPTGRLKPAQKQDVLSPDCATGRSIKPTRLLSCGEMGSGIAQSTPLGATKGMASNIALRSVSATPNSKPVSALPTPISRRTPGLVTPRTIPRPISTLRPAIVAVHASSQSAKKSPTGSVECEQILSKVTKSPCSPTEEDHAASTVCCSLNFSPEIKPEFIAQSEETESVAEKPSEVLLIDVAEDKADIKLKKMSSVDAECQPLIDLSNTPEFNKRLVPIKPANIGQLIDLSSPLIMLSPVRNKENLENDSPLLKF